MTGGFRAETARIAAGDGEFAGFAERVDRLQRDLAEGVAAAGACWGGDDIGLSFAAAHAAPAQSTLDALAALPGRLSDVATRFAGTADAYRATEHENARDLRAEDD